MNIIIKLISNILREYADKLESDNSNLSTDEALELISNIAHINLDKDKQQVANRYNTSTKTIERRESEGSFPKSHPVRITKKLWYLDELLEYERQFQ